LLLLRVDQLVVAGGGRQTQLERGRSAGAGEFDVVAAAAAGFHDGDVVAFVVRAFPADADGVARIGFIGPVHAGRQFVGEDGPAGQDRESVVEGGGGGVGAGRSRG